MIGIALHLGMRLADEARVSVTILGARAELAARTLARRAAS